MDSIGSNPNRECVQTHSWLTPTVRAPERAPLKTSQAPSSPWSYLRFSLLYSSSHLFSPYFSREFVFRRHAALCLLQSPLVEPCEKSVSPSLPHILQFYPSLLLRKLSLTQPLTQSKTTFYVSLPLFDSSTSHLPVVASLASRRSSRGRGRPPPSPTVRAARVDLTRASPIDTADLVFLRPNARSNTLARPTEPPPRRNSR